MNTSRNDFLLTEGIEFSDKISSSVWKWFTDNILGTDRKEKSDDISIIFRRYSPVTLGTVWTTLYAKNAGSMTMNSMTTWIMCQLTKFDECF